MSHNRSRKGQSRALVPVSSISPSVIINIDQPQEVADGLAGWKEKLGKAEDGVQAVRKALSPEYPGQTLTEEDINNLRERLAEQKPAVEEVTTKTTTVLETMYITSTSTSNSLQQDRFIEVMDKYSPRVERLSAEVRRLDQELDEKERQEKYRLRRLHEEQKEVDRQERDQLKQQRIQLTKNVLLFVPKLVFLLLSGSFVLLQTGYNVIKNMPAEIQI